MSEDFFKSLKIYSKNLTDTNMKKASKSGNVNRFVRASWIFLMFVLPCLRVITGLFS